MPVVESTAEPLKDFKRTVLNLRYCAIARVNEVQISYLIMADFDRERFSCYSLFFFTLHLIAST